MSIAKDGDVGEGEAVPFRFVRNGRYVNAFLIRFQGTLYAYENKCRHIPISLDYDDARFFDSERRYLVCQTHGATYAPDSGLCVGGPCEGAVLFDVPFEVEDGEIYVESEDGA